MFQVNTYPLLVSICFISILSACGASFDPLQPNEEYVFSMYGTLDVHADTQWVRVMPIGETLIPESPEPTDVKVFLIRESTGESVVMNDSLFRFGGTTYVWNYWTTVPIQPDEEYTIIAEAPDGRQSIAEITMPSALSIPNVEYSESLEQGTVTGVSEDSLVVLEVKYLVQVIDLFGCFQEAELVFSYIDDYSLQPNGSYAFSFENIYEIRSRLGDACLHCYVVNKRELVVVSASENWPFNTDLSEAKTILPETPSNVRNGVGLIAGIASRAIEISPRQAPC